MKHCDDLGNAVMMDCLYCTRKYHKEGQKNNILLSHVCIAGNLEMLKLLIELGYDPYMEDYDNDCLYYSCWCVNDSITRYLFEFDRAKKKFNYNQIIINCIYIKWGDKLFELLLDSGVNVTGNVLHGKNLLHYCVLRNQLEFFNYFAKYIDVNAVSDKGYTCTDIIFHYENRGLLDKESELKLFKLLYDNFAHYKDYRFLKDDISIKNKIFLGHWNAFQTLYPLIISAQRHYYFDPRFMDMLLFRLIKKYIC